MATLDTRRTAKQNKDENLRKALADLSEKKKKRSDSLDEEAASKDALNEEDVSNEAGDFTEQSSSPTLPEAATPLQEDIGADEESADNGWDLDNTFLTIKLRARCVPKT